MGRSWESSEPVSAERRRAAYFEVSRRLGASRSPGEAARIIVEVAQELLGWDACTMDLYSPETKQVQAVLAMDSFDGGPVDVPPAYTACPPSPVFARVIREGALMVLRPGMPIVTEGWVPFGDTS